MRAIFQKIFKQNTNDSPETPPENETALHEPRQFSEEDLDNLETIMPTIDEAWIRCEKMSDEEAIITFNECNPITSQDWKIYLAMNLASRFIQDHVGTPRKHPKSRKKQKPQ